METASTWELKCLVKCAGLLSDVVSSPGPSVAEYEPGVKRYSYSTVIHYTCGYAMNHWKETERLGFTAERRRRSDRFGMNAGERVIVLSETSR